MSDVTSLPTTQPAATADAADLGVVEAAVLLRAGSLSAVELTEACLSRIEERNGGSATFDGAQDAVNAWVRLYPELAREPCSSRRCRSSRSSGPGYERGHPAGRAIR